MKGHPRERNSGRPVDGCAQSIPGKAQESNRSARSDASQWPVAVAERLGSWTAEMPTISNQKATTTEPYRTECMTRMAAFSI